MGLKENIQITFIIVFHVNKVLKLQEQPSSKSFNLVFRPWVMFDMR